MKTVDALVNHIVDEVGEESQLSPEIKQRMIDKFRQEMDQLPQYQRLTQDERRFVFDLLNAAENDVRAVLTRGPGGGQADSPGLHP